MNTIAQRILNVSLVFFMLVTLLNQNVLITSAATTATVYEYSSMLEDKGNIYYIQTEAGEKESYSIYRLEIATGNKTKLVSTTNYVLNMMVHNDVLYYTSYETEEEGYQIYSVSIDSKDQKTVCAGFFMCLDDSGIYYTVTEGEKSKLYKRDYDSKEATLIYTGNTSFSFVNKLDNILYFTQFNGSSSKVVLYTLGSGQSKLDTLTTDKVTLDGTENTSPAVSDVVNVNGDIYYQYGTYQGSGSYWYGTLKKLDTRTKKKSVITKNLYEDQIYHNDSNIFYSGTESSGKNYRYNTKTNKTTSYKLKITGTESINILGDKTYSGKADGKESITISQFTSGTNRKNLVKSFINISFKQKKNYDYSLRVLELGDYLLIPVTCMDYSDTNYGWRGRCVSITWFVADSNGKILAQF